MKVVKRTTVDKLTARDYDRECEITDGKDHWRGTLQKVDPTRCQVWLKTVLGVKVLTLNPWEPVRLGHPKP